MIRKVRNAAKNVKKNGTYLMWLFALPVLLSFVGLFFVFEASSIKSFSTFGDSFHYLKLQLVWIFLGLCLMFVFSFVDYHKWYYLSFILMTSTIILLILVLIIGRTPGGTKGWIDFGFFRLQPTEFAKFATIIYLSAWFMHRERKRFFSFMILLGGLIFLIMLQPDLGQATLIFILSLVMYFLAGVDLHYLLALVPASAIGFFILIKVAPYRFKRLTAFLDPAADPLGVSYHINQILISVTHGGIFGRGFGASRQKYLFLPEAHTDSVFAIIAEEFGFIGSVVLIGVIFLFIYLLYRVSAEAGDRFGKLLAGGIFAFFALQVIVNLGGMVNIMPLTGVPLPFISYGGSHMLISFMLLGIAINIAKKAGVKRS